jgi:hypothetical protein
LKNKYFSKSASFNDGQANAISSFQKNIYHKKSGFLLKKGDGPIDFGWNPRFIILDRKMLMYYKYQEDKTPRAVIRLAEATVSTVIKYEERDFVFYIELSNPNRRYYFCGETKQVNFFI